jgi:hypothetical protein
MSTRSFTTPNGFRPSNIIHEEEDNNDIEELPDLRIDSNGTSAEDVEESLPSIDDSEEPISGDDFFSSPAFHPTLRRSTSHESILSIGGIDIHTLHSRPSQITITNSGAMIRPRTRGFNAPSTSHFSADILSSSFVIAQPTLSRNNHSSSAYLRSSMGLPERSESRNSTRSGYSAHSGNSSEGLSKKVGGWVWGRWGVQPTSTPPPSYLVASTTPATPKPAMAALRAVSTPVVPVVQISTPETPQLEVPVAPETPTPVQRVGSTPAAPAHVDPMQLMFGRAPGINQKGPIPGFRRSEKAPSKVTAERVDLEALGEVLLE